MTKKCVHTWLRPKGAKVRCRLCGLILPYSPAREFNYTKNGSHTWFELESGTMFWGKS